MINIKRNDYVIPTEVRDEVVQGICEAFLGGNCWSTYHPIGTSAYRRETSHIIKRKGADAYYGFNDEIFSGDEGVRFNGAEMRKAFEVLIEAGYHMFRRYDYGVWKAYVCCKRPYCEGGVEVKEFTDFID